MFKSGHFKIGAAEGKTLDPTSPIMHLDRLSLEPPAWTTVHNTHCDITVTSSVHRRHHTAVCTTDCI